MCARLFGFVFGVVFVRAYAFYVCMCILSILELDSIYRKHGDGNVARSGSIKIPNLAIVGGYDIPERRNDEKKAGF